jgi:hypothetical protein
MLMPGAKMVHARVAINLRGTIVPPNQPFHVMYAEGFEVGDAYSQAIDAILAHPELSQWEYLYTQETDNLVPSDILLRLIADLEEHPEYACVGGLYWTKGSEWTPESGVPQIWGDITDPIVNYRPQAPRPGEIVECYGTGMGANLWRLSMFKDTRFPRPLFRTKASIEGVGTQDLAFWGEARKLGYRCAVDCRILVGHMDVNTGRVY